VKKQSLSFAFREVVARFVAHYPLFVVKSMKLRSLYLSHSGTNRSGRNLLRRRRDVTGAAMRQVVAGLMLGGFAVASVARSTPPPLYDPVALDIGLNCAWQQRCIAQQKRAMGKALKFVAKSRPPAWRVQLCNKNAGRSATRVDWVGFDHCIRNETLHPLPPPPPPQPPHPINRHHGRAKSKRPAGRAGR
jgi:hypothetical protein